MPKPFQIAVPDAVLADLAERLARTRAPRVTPLEAGWRHGMNAGYMARLLDHWRDSYDWRRAETALNRFPQFTAEVTLDGAAAPLNLHYIRQPGEGENALPLLLLHGWPGSVFEFQEVIGPLTRPSAHGGEASDGFEVIAPSLPGYGFSSAPPAPIGPRAIGAVMHRLMSEVLGIDRYIVQGGDWGAIISAWMALDQPEAVLGAHLNMAGLRPSTGPDDPPLSEEEKTWIAAARARMKLETAYQDTHATTSETLAWSLMDSPAGLAACIVEKFHGWTAPEAAEPPFTMDQLLTNVMIYWVTGSINSSTWLYRGFREAGDGRAPAGRRIEVPCAYQLAPMDLVPPPPTSWLERVGPVSQRNDLAEGGHFVALENGPALIDDLRVFAADHLR